MSTTVVFRGSRRELDEILASVPQILAGRIPDPLGITRLVGFTMANSMLTQVYQDFVRKSRGEVGKDGVKWAPLAASTIAKRMAKERKLQPKTKRAKKPKADPKFAERFDIGRDTTRLLRSLVAGRIDQVPGNPDTSVTAAMAVIAVGTNVPYAKWFREGRGKVQPARPVVPLDGTIPAAWWLAILGAGSRGVSAAIAMLAQRGGFR